MTNNSLNLATGRLILFRHYTIITAVAWTLLISCSLGIYIHQIEGETKSIGLNMARALLEKDILYRRWASSHGGIYVPLTPQTPPNKYLSHIPERDIATPSGKRLTLMNPAYMNRQVFEMVSKSVNTHTSHLTSLKPIRPENAPDPWEIKALANFASGSREASEVVYSDGQPVMRLMWPLMAEKSCLSCHAVQGYREGEIRGGIGVSLPMYSIHKSIYSVMRTVISAHIFIWLVGLATIWFGARKITSTTSQLATKVSELELAMAEVKQLKGIIPICMYCKKIRDDSEYWQQLEAFITKHSDAEFSHSICPECFELHQSEWLTVKETDG